MQFLLLNLLLSLQLLFALLLLCSAGLLSLVLLRGFLSPLALVLNRVFEVLQRVHQIKVLLVERRFGALQLSLVLNVSVLGVDGCQIVVGLLLGGRGGLAKQHCRQLCLCDGHVNERCIGDLSAHLDLLQVVLAVFPSDLRQLLVELGNHAHFGSVLVLVELQPHRAPLALRHPLDARHGVFGTLGNELALVVVALVLLLGDAGEERVAPSALKQLHLRL